MAIHVVSAFCTEIQVTLGYQASRGKGFELLDALRLLERIELKGQIVTGDAMFCQKTIAAKITGHGGDFVLPVKDNQKELRKDIKLAFKKMIAALETEEAKGRFITALAQRLIQNEFEPLLAGAGIKIYLTANEATTAKEI